MSSYVYVAKVVHKRCSYWPDRIYSTITFVIKGNPDRDYATEKIHQFLLGTNYQLLELGEKTVAIELS